MRELICVIGPGFDEQGGATSGAHRREGPPVLRPHTAWLQPRRAPNRSGSRWKSDVTWLRTQRCPGNSDRHQLEQDNNQDCVRNDTP